MSPPTLLIGQESIPYLLDEVFAPLERLFPPEIRFTLAPDGSARVESVCGKQGAGPFLNLLKFLKAETVATMTATLSRVAPADADLFLSMAQRRVRRLLSATITLAQGGRSFDSNPVMTWRSSRVRCIVNDRPATDPRHIVEVIRQTRRQATLACLVLRQLEERMNCMVCIPAGHGTPPEQVRDPFPKTKFRLTCSVLYLGAFVRLLLDRQLLVNPNILDLCRRIAAGVSTVRTENISHLSLNNAVHTPDPLALEQLLADLKIMVRCVEKMLERG